MTVLKIEGIGKAFRTYRSEWQRVLSWLGLSVVPREEKWILRDITFSLEAGEAVGIVGQNGAGKSTLLKMLCNTLAPSAGTIEVNGRIAALLELGMGFNPDLTGRANVMNTAGLMGFTHDQILGVMSEIEAFAEIGTYFDEPLRTYSSGMQVRLAFSVATAFRPEILIVDEALSVGDAYFQHKSFNRIKQFQKEGTTLLLVSHDRSAVISLCDRAILIEKGEIRKDGPPEDVLDLYNALIAEKEGGIVSQTKNKDGRIQTVSGTGEAVIADVVLLDAAGCITDAVSVGEAVILEVKAKIVRDIPELVAGYMIKDRLGQAIFGTNTFHLDRVLYNLKAGEELMFRFKFNANFGNGNYSVAVSLHQSEAHVAYNYEWQDLAYTFAVVNADKQKFVGVAWVPPGLEIVR